MNGFDLAKSRGKNRGDKFRNKSKKLFTRCGDDHYPEHKPTIRAQFMEKELYQRHFNGYCYPCESMCCVHMINTRLKLIWYAHFSKNSPFSKLPKDIIRIIIHHTIDHSMFDINGNALKETYFSKVMTWHIRMSGKRPYDRTKKQLEIKKQIVEDR